MEQHEVEAIAKRRCVILDKVTLWEKGIKILNLEQFMRTQTKHNYDKHVEWMENWKDIAMEGNWDFKVTLVPLFLMGWEAPMPNVMLEFLNTFLIKGVDIYFRHKDKVYVITYCRFFGVHGRVCRRIKRISQ